MQVASGGNTWGQIWSFCAVPGWLCANRKGEKMDFSLKTNQSKPECDIRVDFDTNEYIYVKKMKILIQTNIRINIWFTNI